MGGLVKERGCCKFRTITESHSTDSLKCAAICNTGQLNYHTLWPN